MLPLAAALSLLTAAILGWACYRIAIQNGRLLLHIEALENAIGRSGPAPPPSDASSPLAPAPERAGLALGTVGNDFDLPDLWGGRGTLSDRQGLPVLLVFIAPDCPHSRALLPQLAPLSRRSGDGDPVLLLVSTGDAVENLPLVEPLGIRAPILLQEDWEVGELYWVQGTPAAYLLDERGAIASGLALGAPAVLELAEATRATDRPSPAPPAAAQVTPRRSRVPLGQAAPLIPLQPGAPAPAFSLPRLGGGEAGPLDFPGRRLLLVFSDPLCAPCVALVRQLEAIHRRQTAPDVLLVSRRDREMARAEAHARALTYPIVLQRGWEISSRVGVLATPAAYLIDEAGTIAAGPAIGAKAVAELLAQVDGEPAREGDAAQ